MALGLHLCTCFEVDLTTEDELLGNLRQLISTKAIWGQEGKPTLSMAAV